MPEPRRSWFMDMVDNADTGGSKTEGNEGEISVVKKGKRGGKTEDS